MSDTIIITIMKDGDNGEYLFKWKDLRMVEAWGGYGFKSSTGVLFVNMQELTSFVNNNMNLAALFEVE